MVQHWLGKKFRVVTIYLILMFSLTTTLFGSEQSDYSKIIDSSYRNSEPQTSWLCRSFYKKYPYSNLTPDVKMIEMQTIHNINQSIVGLKSIIIKYPNFKHKDLCQYRICEILYLSGNWKDLEKQSISGINTYGKNSRFYPFFLHFRSKAAFYTQNYDQSIRFANLAFAADHSFIFYPELKLQKIFSEQKINYNSALYTKELKNSFYELQDSGAEVSSLYLLGRSLEIKNRYNLAYSVYTDLIQKYPRSPEALLSHKRVTIIAAQKPSYIKNSLAQIAEQEPDIVAHLSPDSMVEDRNFKQYYALAVGPFYNLSEAEKLFFQLKKSFGYVAIVRGYKNFTIYIERSSSSESVMHHKIRLAEEFGINSDIVYIASEKNVHFIHKD